MVLHLKILGIIYLLVAGLSAAFALLIALLSFTKGPQAGPAPFIFLGLAVWFLQTGAGLWRRRRGVRMLAVVTGGALLVLLNALLLFADSGRYSSSAGQTIFHSLLIGTGLYTLAVVLHPRAKASMV